MAMKTTHPTYYEDALVTCACGATFTTGSTKPKLNVEQCSSCHPFFAGASTMRPTSSRIERFKARLARATA